MSVMQPVRNILKFYLALLSSLGEREGLGRGRVSTVNLTNHKESRGHLQKDSCDDQWPGSPAGSNFIIYLIDPKLFSKFQLFSAHQWFDIFSEIHNLRLSSTLAPNQLPFLPSPFQFTIQCRMKEDCLSYHVLSAPSSVCGEEWMLNKYLLNFSIILKIQNCF